MNDQAQFIALILGAYLLVTVLIIIFDPNTKDVRDRIRTWWKK